MTPAIIIFCLSMLACAILAVHFDHEEYRDWVAGGIWLTIAISSAVLVFGGCG